MIGRRLLRRALPLVLAVFAAPAAAQPDDPRAQAAAGDPEGDPIDFADAEIDARHVVYRRDVELYAGTPHDDAAELITRALLGDVTFPLSPDPFAAGLEQSAWTPAMAELLPIVVEARRFEADLYELRRMQVMWDRLVALDDVPRWALECRWALLGGPPDPTPCEKLAETHAIAHGWADRRVARLLAFARAIEAGRRPQEPLGDAPLEREDPIRAAGANARLALDAFDRQINAGLTPLQAAGVLARWQAGEINLYDLSPPLPADAGAWSTDVAEGVVLRTWIGRRSVDVVRAYGSLPRIEGRRLLERPDAYFGALRLWAAIDPPGGPDDVPALAARCREARIAAADDPAVSRAPCAALADVIEVAAGPFDPAVNAWRAAAGAPHDPQLAELARPAVDDREAVMDLMVFELAGHALTWDAEVAAGTPIAEIPGVMARYRTFEPYSLGPRLMGPPPDGGAWAPAIVDGVVAVTIEGQLNGDPLTGIGGLDAWSAVVSGPGGGPERHDVPALTARCRMRLMRWQIGPAAPDPADCAALADTLEYGLGPLHPDTLGARLRALTLADEDPEAIAEQRAALDAPWATADGETRRAQIRLAGLGDPLATLYREDYVDFFDTDSEELLDEWDRDLAAGMDSERAAAAVAVRARQWLRTVAIGLAPPFPVDAGAWPAPLVEGLVSVVEIGRRLGRADWVFGPLPALARADRSPTAEPDEPALSIRCRAAEIEATDGRPADDIEACERLYFAHRAALGPVHPRLTDHRLRLARIAAARGQRAAAAEWLAEAVEAWADPEAVDSQDEAVWAAARAVRAWGEARAALGEARAAAELLAEGRKLAATTGYARVGDGLRFLGEEVRVLADAGDQDAALARFEEIGAELEAIPARVEARAAEDELNGAWADTRVMALAAGGMSLDVALALDRLRPDADSAASLVEFAELGWTMMRGSGLTDHPLAVELLAALARLRAGQPGIAAQATREARQALALQARIDRRTRPWLAPMAAAEVAHRQGRPDVAIAWAKRAVDMAQAARAEVGALGPEAEQRFVEARVELYTLLGGWLIEAGRLVEADEVERRVGELRLAGLTRSAQATAARDPISRSRAELRWAARLADATARLRAGRADTEGFVDALGDADDALVEDTVELPSPVDEQVDGQVDMTTRLAGLESAALLQVVLGAEQVHLVLSTAEGRQTQVRPIGAAALNGMAHDFYRALRSGAPIAALDHHAQALYRALLEPVAPTLDRLGIRTLMVAPGGALRYVPFGALMGPGGRYAIEDRAIVRYPVLSPTLLDGPPRRPDCLGAAPPADCIAAFGARVHGDGLGNLAFVPAELEGIVRRRLTDLDGRVAGSVYLDAAFTAEALRSALQGGVPLVHVASHFVFHPGSATRSFLALGGGARLDLERLAGPAFPFDRVELLSLSACETAVGTFAAGQPPDSFAALALSKGAGAVLASLWPVPDDSTATLMRGFYGHLAGGASKAEALRQAQLELMRGPAPRAPSRKFGLPGVEVPTGAHPYAWAPFVLTGDWR